MTDSNLKKCVICIEDILTDIDFLPCAHAFHQECIAGWLHLHTTCPVCKVPTYVNSPDQLLLYNNHKARQGIISDNESVFFQNVSAGAYDNLDDTYNNNQTHVDREPRSRDLTDLVNSLISTGSGIVFRRMIASMDDSLTNIYDDIPDLMPIQIVDDMSAPSEIMPARVRESLFNDDIPDLMPIQIVDGDGTHLNEYDAERAINADLSIDEPE
jgi:hypothetical protein